MAKVLLKRGVEDSLTQSSETGILAATTKQVSRRREKGKLSQRTTT